MKNTIFTVLLLIHSLLVIAQTQIPLTWDDTQVVNCDSDGSLSITNNGSRVSAMQLEGPNCDPCTTFSAATGTCVLDATGSLCSDGANLLVAFVPINNYSQINITAAISPTTVGTHESQCSVSDWAFIQIIAPGNTQILNIGEIGLNSQVNESLVYTPQTCSEQLIVTIITKSNSFSDNEGFIFDILMSGDEIQTIPPPQDLDVRINSLGCPGDFTDIVLNNCPTCTSISATPINGGSPIISSGSTIQIPIPDPVTQGSTLYDISYTDGICTFSFPFDVPYISVSFFNYPFYPDTYCPGKSFSLPTSFNIVGNTINGNWSGPGVMNNVFSDPQSGMLGFTITYTATNCSGLVFTQDISIASPDYEGPNKLIGSINNTSEYKAQGNIESEQIIMSAADILYQSGTQISLDFPFEVRNGGLFHAMIKACE